MNTIKTLFIDVAYEEKSVSDLIKVLTDKNIANMITEDEKNAYQAFCCALLAKEAKNIMQKGQYIQEYNIFIQKSLYINYDCIVARLIRLMVETQLQDVNFTSHIDDDSHFLSENINTSSDEELIKLIIKILSR